MPVHSFNSFQCSVAFHIETSHLINTANQMSIFCLTFNSTLKEVNGLVVRLNGLIIKWLGRCISNSAVPVLKPLGFNAG